MHIVCANFLGFKVDMYIVYGFTNLYHHSLFSVIIFSLFSSQHSGLKQTLLQTKKRALKNQIKNPLREPSGLNKGPNPKKAKKAVKKPKKKLKYHNGVAE